MLDHEIAIHFLQWELREFGVVWKQCHLVCDLVSLVDNVILIEDEPHLNKSSLKFPKINCDSETAM